MKQLQDIKVTEQMQIEQVALGNGSAFIIWVFERAGWIYIAIEGKGAYKFSTRVDGMYVSEKLGLLRGDADVFAEWLNREMW